LFKISIWELGGSVRMAPPEQGFFFMNFNNFV